MSNITPGSHNTTIDNQSSPWTTCLLHYSPSNHTAQHFSARLTLKSAKTTRQPTADKTNPPSRHEQPQHNRTIACNHAIQPSTNHNHTRAASNIPQSYTAIGAIKYRRLNTGWQAILSLYPVSSLPVFRPFFTQA